MRALRSIVLPERLQLTCIRYKQAAKKFKSIFSLNRNVPMHYIVGNNDVGYVKVASCTVFVISCLTYLCFRLGLVPSTTKKIRSYYLDTFGTFNEKFEIANHTFIGLDTPGIIDEDYQRHGKYITFDDWKPIPGGPISFVNEVAECEQISFFPLQREAEITMNFFNS